MFKFYLTDRSENEATSYYLSLIERAIEHIGSASTRVFTLDEIQEADIIITIEAKDFLKAHIFKPKTKKINWFQGITPEEAMLVYQNRLRKIIWEWFERITLRNSKLNLFVSEAMRQHYYSKYNYRQANYLTIPCYNSRINANAFYAPAKYNKPSFVYAGSLSKWQCIDQVLTTFKLVQSRLPKAELTILTYEHEQAKTLVDKLGVKNTQVKYVKSGQIGNEMKLYKYGFLLREEHVVNQVATPTKMSTYLANGLIPIFSDVFSAFIDNISLKGYEIRVPAGLTPNQIATIIVDYENASVVEPGIFLEKCQRIFDTYYNDEIYIKKLGKIFNELSLH